MKIASLQHFFLKPFKVRSPVNQYYLKQNTLKIKFRNASADIPDQIYCLLYCYFKLWTELFLLILILYTTTNLCWQSSQKQVLIM